MTPIPDILQQVHDLLLTPADALPLIQQHIDAARSRDAFAAQALGGLLAAGVRMADSNALAMTCFAHADACMAVGTVQAAVAAPTPAPAVVVAPAPTPAPTPAPAPAPAVAVAPVGPTP